jgi:hypothetical protein
MILYVQYPRYHTGLQITTSFYYHARDTPLPPL